ncbi:MAG TPA: ribonuclease H [Candidatus Binataceae bacterium]|nr:ribonuclease H [Candidatus Binataceae bacterium]
MPEAQAPEWIAYADGSCLGNPGPGGWAVVLLDPQRRAIELTGAAAATTNNRMEITAALEAMRHTPPGIDLLIRSDSQYVVKTMTLGWRRRENLDLWALLDAEAARRRVRWEWVRGHNGDPLNERADELARCAAAGKLPSEPTARASAEPRAGAAPTAPAAMLRAGEAIRVCAHCGRDFIAANDARFCSLVECQRVCRS